MKKIYLKPDIIIVDIYPTRILENSGEEPKVPVDTDPDKFIDKPEGVW